MAALPSSTANALSSDVVISAVYGGGGNSGAVFKNDYIELANTTGSPVDVSSWSVQYASAAGTVFQLTSLTGSIPAHGRYLVQEAAGAAGTVALPTPDAIGTIPMSGTSGVVAPGHRTDPAGGLRHLLLRPLRTSRTWSVTARPRTSRPLAAPALTNTTANARTGALTDTDNNAADFVSGVPKATNSAGTTVTAGRPGRPRRPDPRHAPGSTTSRARAGSPRSSGRTSRTSPASSPAVRVTGNSRGFWFQDPTADADPLTSEGLFVFTGSTSPTVVIGDSVLVSGRVTEYRPATGAQTLTELGGTVNTIRLTGGNALPARRPGRLPRRLHQERQPGGPAPGAVLVRAGLA